MPSRNVTPSFFYQGGAKPTAEETVNESFSVGSPLFLSKKRGTKIDFIRVVNSLYALAFFTDDKGGKVSKKDVMIAVGKAVNIDLTEYQNKFSTTSSSDRSGQ